GFPIVQRCAAAAGAVVTPVADDTGAPQRVSAALVEKIAADLAFQAPPTVPESVHWPEFTGYPLPGGGRFAFLDLLSANDVVSSALLLEHARRQNPEAAGPLVLLLATRADRPLRTVAFVEWLASLSGVAGFVPVGSHALYAHAALRRRRMPLLFRLPPLFPAPSRLLSRISGITGPGFRLVGLGNAHGHGERLRAYLEQEVRPCC
ncbi:MAG: hypothetical protein LBR29_06035, partial [Methylobacteriaceae bacterium]|nr:hypothetical protein [Methylobacteriaceae bacterium]